MTGTIGIIFGAIVVIAVIYMLVKRYDTKSVLIGGGFVMAIASLKPLTAFNAFSTSMVTPGLIQSICSVMGFAIVMKVTECDKHLIHALAKVLSKVRPLLIPGACIATFVVNISLTSAAGVSAAVGAILIPLLISMGVAPATAGAAVIVGTFGSMLSPGLSHQPIIAKLAGLEIVEVIKVHAVADIACLIIGAVCLTIVAKFMKEDKGYVDPENVQADLSFKVNPLYAVLPLIPVILLLLLNTDVARGMFPWAKEVKVPHAMLFGAFLCMTFTLTKPVKATKAFFEGMGKGYGDIIGIIISAAIFVSGMKAIGMIDAGIDALKTTTHIIPLATTYGPFLLAVVSGSGDAAAIAFNESVTVHAESFGFHVANMGSLAALSGALGRGMSPIAGATIICATLAKVNPFEIAKRNALGMVLASVAAMIILMYL